MSKKREKTIKMGVSRYKKVEIEFVYYDKHVSKSIYSVRLITVDGVVIREGNVFEEDVPSIVKDFMNVDLSFESV